MTVSTTVEAGTESPKMQRKGPSQALGFVGIAVAVAFAALSARATAKEGSAPSAGPGSKTIRTPRPILDLLLRDTPQPNYATPKPARVRGRVVRDTNGNSLADSEDKGVADVSRMTLGQTFLKGTVFLAASQLVKAPLRVEMYFLDEFLAEER